jgi:dienelactone hydrolase
MRITPIEKNSLLLHYRLIEHLGEGGMGVVWKAVDTSLDREVAIKIVPEAFAADAGRLARFEREAKLLASLNHPNVAAVYGLHEAGGVRFLAMELVRGETLTQHLSPGLAPNKLIDLATQIADGLAAAHRQHVIHRDLKPDNIMIDADGRPKILDFGLAKVSSFSAADDATAVHETAMTQEGMLVGTIAYMSPEQAEGKPVDARSDVFSLGIVLYEMATGRRPFGGANSISILTSILRDTPPPVTTIAPAAPPPLDRIIRRCLEKNPEKRYSDASALRDDLRALSADMASHPGWRTATASSKRRYALAGIAAAIVIAVALGGVSLYRRMSQQRWVRDQAVPQLQQMVDRIQALEEGRESWDAWMAARRIESIAPDDPILKQLRPKFTRPLTITSTPPGAEVYARYYDDVNAQPVLIGRTPLRKVPFPRGFTRIRLQVAGKEPIDDVLWNFPLIGTAFDYRFHAAGEIPAEMSFVPGAAFPLFMPGLDHLQAEPTTDFLMDRHEVSNREYKKFVDAGGYADPKYWREPFLDKDRTLTFSEAVARFTDRTGRPGPSTWEVGSYAEGQGDYPVSGVSWYEAAAYARWAGKSLPTIFHWNRVAFTVASSRIIPMSNLAGKAPQSVGATKSMNRFGVSDLAGNVREWTWNATNKGAARYILGGGWNDPDYAFADAYAQPPFDRTQTNGFRCIRYIAKEPNLTALERAVDQPARNFFAEKPVSDETFAQYLRQFAYDKSPLDARIEEDKLLPEGRRQKITFNAAYGHERMTAFLFLPRAGKPPYQVAVVFPGSGVISQRSSDAIDMSRFDFLVRSGRALLYPIYKGTFERGGDLHSDYPDETAAYKDYVIMWAKDLGRSIDYVETRRDLDAGRIAYCGFSWGAANGPVMTAVEKRIKANVLYVAGMYMQRSLPEVDGVNYVGRVKQPTLVLNGELDFYFPVETSQRPLFELLGTAPADKKRLVYPGGHSVPRTEMIRESLAWLDRYLGPVR